MVYWLIKVMLKNLRDDGPKTKMHLDCNTVTYSSIDTSSAVIILRVSYP